MTITLDLPNDVASRLQVAARVQGKDIATYLVDDVRLQLRKDVLSESETQLLDIVNRPVEDTARRERDRLLRLQAKRGLSEAESEKLKGLIDAMELANAERWQAIASLAKLRGLTLSEVTQDLQIPLS